MAAFSSFFLDRKAPYLVIIQTYSDDINFIVPPIWPYILERKFTALLETGVHFVNIMGEWGSSLRLIDSHFGGIFEFFLDRKAPYLVIIQTYSDDINFIVPPIWPYILGRKFTALLETGVHFVNIAGEKGFLG